MSARSNQDMQRANEEVAVKKITTILSRRTFSIPDDTNKSTLIKAWNQQAIPHGKCIFGNTGLIGIKCRRVGKTDLIYRM